MLLLSRDISGMYDIFVHIMSQYRYLHVIKRCFKFFEATFLFTHLLDHCLYSLQQTAEIVLLPWFKFWPKFPNLDLKTTIFHVLFVTLATNFEKILTLMSVHHAPTRLRPIALPIHQRKLDKVFYKTSLWPTDDRIRITSCELDALDTHVGWFEFTWYVRVILICKKGVHWLPIG